MKYLIALTIQLLTPLAALANESLVTPMGLCCEYMTAPIGIGVPEPRLSWKLIANSSEARGLRQSAYQILVASAPALLAKDNGDVWDSGKISSDNSVNVPFAGKPLISAEDLFWKVRVWDGGGFPSAWSEPARWSMGLLKPEDWHAKWIVADEPTPDNVSPWLRKEFVLEEKPSSGLAYMNILGYGELYVNGQKVGADVLTPAVADTKDGLPYVTYDIAPFLKKGRNCVAVWLGKGSTSRFFYTYKKRHAPAVRLQCDLIIGGTACEIVTDSTWKVAPSSYSTLAKSPYGGETCDARLEQPGWNLPGFDDSGWVSAQEVPLWKPRALAQIAPLNRLNPPIAAKSITDLGGGRYEIDFGTCLTGWMELRIPALPAGQKVVMEYADKWEPINANPPPGTPPQRKYQSFNQVDEFISNGNPGVFCSKFNYHGFRYALVSGLPDGPKLEDAQARLIDADVESRGAFECSNPLLNRIHAIHLWTVRCLNLGAYMVDCPHRERLGYGDAQVSPDTCLYNFDYGAFYTKWLRDWRVSANEKTGEIPHTAPSWGGGGGPGWGGALAVIASRMYLLTGDRQILERSYDTMRGHLNWIESKCKNNILRDFPGRWDFIGDWLAPGRGLDSRGEGGKGDNWPGVPARELFNNCYRLYLWQLQQQAAIILERKDDAAQCQAKLDVIRPLIHATFFDVEKHQYVIDEQAYQILPLMTGVVPEDERAAVLKNLENNILVKNNGHLDTGMLGTMFLVQYLPQIGRNDLLYTIANQKTYPGWGFIVEQGATTLWEQWNGFFSQIHSCFISLDGWFYESLAGIAPDATAPGFKKIVIKPTAVGDLGLMASGLYFQRASGLRRRMTIWRKPPEEPSEERKYWLLLLRMIIWVCSFGRMEKELFSCGIHSSPSL